MQNVALSGVGHSKIGRSLDRQLGLLAVDACREAIADSGLDISDIDGIATQNMITGSGQLGAVDGIHSLSLGWVIHALGLKDLSYWSETSAGNISTVIGHGIYAVAAGACKNLLVFRAMRMPRRATDLTANLGAATGIAAYSSPYGLSSAPLSFALNYMRYQKLYGAKREHLAAYALAARRGANRNPRALFFDRPLTMVEYMSCRMIADPLCLYDCDIPVDGAAAVVITSAEHAMDLKVPPAHVSGVGQAGWNPAAVTSYDDIVHTACSLGERLWFSSHLRPSDIDGAMLYDGFAPDIYFWLEGFGFCATGEAYDWIQNGRIDLGGELPINTFGGSLSEGRLHGMGHWVEAALQVQGRAGGRQIMNAGHVLVATGLLGHGSGAILSRDRSDATNEW